MMKALSKGRAVMDYQTTATGSPKSSDSPRLTALRLTDRLVGPSMKAPAGVSGVLSPLTAGRLNTLQVIRSWDKNKDGTIDPSELRHIAKSYISKESQVKRHRRIAICAVISVLLSLFGVLAMTILANELSKDTKQRNDGILTTREDGHATTIKTGQARFTYGLESLPLVPRAALSKLKEISFEVPDGPWIHMHVSTFRHFPDKLLISSTAQERLQLHFADSLVNYLNPPLGLNLSFYGAFDLSSRRRRLQAVTGPLPGTESAIFGDGPPPAETAVATFNDDMMDEVLAGTAVEALVDGPLAVSMVRTKDEGDETVYRVAIFNLAAAPIDVSAFGIGFRLPHEYLEASSSDFDLTPGAQASNPVRVALRRSGPLLAPSPHDGTTPSYSGSITVRPGTHEDIAWVSTNFPHGSQGVTRIVATLGGQGRVFATTPVDIAVTFSSPVVDLDVTRVQLYGVPLSGPMGIQLLDFTPSSTSGSSGTSQGATRATLRLNVVPGSCGGQVSLMLAYGVAVDEVGVRSEAATVTFFYDEDPKREMLLRVLQGLSSAPLGSGLPDAHGWQFCSTHCAWDGVTCDADGAVTSLELFSRGLTGSIPESVGQLGPQLHALDLSDNALTGTIPGPALASLTGLKELVLNGNELSGELPVESLLDLTSLETVNLGDNSLGGTLPKSLGRVPSLVELHLQGNKFRGGLPAELGLLDRLVTLDLSLNALAGTIPASIVMDSLDSMNVMFNRDVCGDVPPALEGKVILFQTGLGHPCPGTGLMDPPLASAPGLQTTVPASASSPDGDDGEALAPRFTPSGAVGPRHFVQVVDQPAVGYNSTNSGSVSAVFMVYKKDDLTPVTPLPVRLSTLHPEGSVCASGATGNGRDLYDHVASRFVLFELASGTGFTSVESLADDDDASPSAGDPSSGSTTSDAGSAAGGAHVSGATGTGNEASAVGGVITHVLCFLVSSSEDPSTASWVPFSFPTALGRAHDARLGLWVDTGFRPSDPGYVGGSNSAYLVTTVETVDDGSNTDGSSSGTATSTGGGGSGSETGLLMYVLERNQMLNVTELVANLAPDSINSDAQSGWTIQHPRWQHFSLSPDAEAGFPRPYLRLSPVTLAPGPEAPANKCPLFLRHVPYRLSRGGPDAISGAGGEVQLLRACVNFLYPPASRVTHASVQLADFYSTICGSGAGVACIPQADSAARLDPGKESLLANPIYRRVPLPPSAGSSSPENFADIITGVFTVDANQRDPFRSGGEEQAGLRWFRMRASGPSWAFALEQEGTWALADKDHALAGAAVTDARGNLALAYFASGVLKHPQLRYVGIGRPANASGSGTASPGATASSSVAGGGEGSRTEQAAFYEGLTGPLPGFPLAAPSLTVDPVDGCTIYVTGPRFVPGGGSEGVVGTGLSTIRFGDCLPA